MKRLVGISVPVTAKFSSHQAGIKSGTLKQLPKTALRGLRETGRQCIENNTRGLRPMRRSSKYPVR